MGDLAKQVKFQPGDAVVDFVDDEKTFVMHVELDLANKKALRYLTKNIKHEAWRTEAELRVLSFDEWSRLETRTVSDPT